MSMLTSEKVVAGSPVAFAPKTKAADRAAQVALRVEVYDDPLKVLPIWQQLMSVAPASAYQTPGFLLPWLVTRGAEAGIKPWFIVQRDVDGIPLAMFCFGIKHFGLFRAAIFLGAKDSNFNFGLFQPSYRPNRETLISLFRDAARKTKKNSPHLLLLYNQPFDWNGWSNPLAALSHQMSPSFAYKINIGTNAERYFAEKLSKDTRKKLRKKESRLSEVAPVRHMSCEDGEAVQNKILEAFFKQKIARFEMQNIEAGFKSPVMRSFIESALRTKQDDRDGQLEMHALSCGEQIVAVYGGATHQSHFSAFFNSFNAEPEIAKSSPGDLLLLKLIAAKSAMGVTSFDLGIGEARYKNMVCNETVALFDSFVPVTTKGWFLALGFSIGLRLKRSLKQNQKAFKILRRVRAALRRKPSTGCATFG